MKKQKLLEVQPVGKKSAYGAAMWGALPVGLLFAGGAAAYISSWGNQAPKAFLSFLMGIFSLGCMAAGEIFGKKRKAFRAFALFPWLTVLVLTGVDCLSGQVLWINVLLARWNQIHEAGLTLFSISAGAAATEAAAMLMLVLQAELVWVLVYRRHKLLLGCYSLLWILLLLLEEAFSPIVCALLLAGWLGSAMASEDLQASWRVRIWTLAAAGVLGICTLFVSGRELEGIRTAREAVYQQIHEWRYGADSLPEGDLRKADRLLQENETLMQVQSEQEKTLYIKGFVGSVMENGIWKELPDAAYGGEDAGILNWLAEKNFDPLTQSARYYSLGDAADRPEENGLTFYVENGSRYYFYAPASLETVKIGNSKEKKDQMIQSKGLWGQKQYKIQELSGSRPSELTIVADWVQDPQNEAQQQYSEAEAVYRDFVYRHYTALEEETDRLMQEWFWEDYETESDGIYSAVSHIRQKLTEGVRYTDTPEAAPEGVDPLRWFLTESREGNAVQYASAAVEALRSHGIPARYVEGYYISSSALAAGENGNVNVSGKEAHAWTEVYFDGVGWMPIDVTPGYYYDTLRLQQMVGMPDTIHKTAALEDNSTLGADEVDHAGAGGGKGKSSDDTQTKPVAAILLGLAAILLILFTVFLAAVELLRGFRLWKMEYTLRKTTGSEQVARLESMMFVLLRLLDIEASLGWETEEIDRQLSERFEKIESGEYSRVCQLMEKAVYGDVLLEPFEERTLYSFLYKLTEVGRDSGWKTRLQIRYLILREGSGTKRDRKKIKAAA